MIGSLLDSLRNRKRRQLWEPTKATGRCGEDLAHRFLRRQGYIVVARNYRLAAGDAEADIIAKDGEIIAIVEVKTRESDAFGPPDRAIDLGKQRALRRVAREYSRKTNTPEDQVRFDVVTVLLANPPRLELLRDAFRW
jgi:putative endonuclease